jgi:RNase P/RNase MRP subunit p30
MINQQNIEKAKNEIKQLASRNQRPIIVKAQNLEFNRKILEYGRFDILLSVEQSSDIRRDKIKQVDSGLNHVLAKIATKNKIALGIDLETIRHKNKKEKAIVLEKLIQNIKLCRKAKCKIVLINYEDKLDAFSFLTSLGAASWQAWNALT